MILMKCAVCFVIGTVDIGHLPHPVLMHLRSFFDLWDAFTLQAVQTGQPYISDHLMFEVRQGFVMRLRSFLFFHIVLGLSLDKLPQSCPLFVPTDPTAASVARPFLGCV